MAEKKEKVGLFTRIGSFFRKLKSELKKVVWSPWQQVKKNTVVVLTVIIASAVAIGIIDWVFQNSILLINNLIK